MVRRRQDQPAAPAERGDAVAHLWRTSLGVPKGKVYCSSIEPQKHRSLPYSRFSLRRVHGGGLDRVEHVEPDLDQLAG